MEIYIVRHGIAEDPDHAKRDSDRRLTEEGHEKTAKAARHFSKRVAKVDMIFHSPFLRAVETAKYFAAEFPKARVEAAGGLLPEDSPKNAQKLLSKLPDGASVMIVGHEPYLSSLTSLLITGSEEPILEFKKAGIAGIECTGSSLANCRLSFLLSPKWL
jgi:phosphohistidine phosphatase